jgi:hypothetical protein
MRIELAKVYGVVYHFNGRWAVLIKSLKFDTIRQQQYYVTQHKLCKQFKTEALANSYMQKILGEYVD